MTNFFSIVGQCSLGAVITLIGMWAMGYWKISIEFPSDKKGPQ